MKRNKREIGSRYEERAAAYLAEQGLTIIERNYRCRGGEIDVIARDGSCWVFCEVKYRYDERAGDPAEAVDAKKQQTIFRVASWYMRQQGFAENTPCRFDVIAVTGVGDALRIRWLRDAFGGF